MAAKVSTEIKKLVYANPNMTPIDIVLKLDEMGVHTSEGSVSGYRSDFLNSLAVLKELGAFENGSAVPAPEKKAKKARQLSRADRWAEACARAQEALSDLRGLQEEYEEWKDNLPESLQSSPVGEKLEEVCNLDIESAVSTVDEAEGIDLPMGFGRD